MCIREFPLHTFLHHCMSLTCIFSDSAFISVRLWQLKLQETENQHHTHIWKLGAGAGTKMFRHFFCGSATILVLWTKLRVPMGTCLVQYNGTLRTYEINFFSQSTVRPKTSILLIQILVATAATCKLHLNGNIQFRQITFCTQFKVQDFYTRF